MIDSLIENVHRQDLSPEEKAKFCKRIMKKENIKNVSELVKRINISRTNIDAWLDYLETQKKITGPKISARFIIEQLRLRFFAYLILFLGLVFTIVKDTPFLFWILIIILSIIMYKSLMDMNKIKKAMIEDRKKLKELLK